MMLSANLCHAQSTTARELREDFDDRLTQLAAKCDELGADEQAAVTRAWILTRGSKRQYLFTRPFEELSNLPPNASALVKSWHRKFVELRTDHAKALFEVARQKAKQGDGTTAYQLLHEVVHHDPEHTQARRILGLNSASPGRISRRSGTRTHTEFDWRRGRYWHVESQHYRITTNVSPEAGVELAKKLEAFHSVWQQVFFEYWSATASLNERFLGGSARLGSRNKLSVVLFADRDEYVEKLQRYEPQIAMSLGYYMKGERTAFFYAGDESVEPTWFHEATHQLFQELGDAISDVGELSNFWIIEGIAVYMESFVQHDGYATVGGVDAERLQYARVRALTGEYYLSLDELVRLGREELQRHKDIRRIYTQSAGLSHFLMDGADGKYRKSLIDFITLLYLGRSQPETLAARCGVDLKALDAEYQEFLIVVDDDLKHLNPPRAVQNLAFGRTKVTDVGVKRLSDLNRLRWLDMSFTGATDDGFTKLKDCVDLQRLNLEGTGISDQSADIIAKFSNLEELDLSGTAITDVSVAKLSNLKQLKILWLTNTAISDSCLVALQDLSKLEFLEVSQTKVTTSGLAALKAKLPNLNKE